MSSSLSTTIEIRDRDALLYARQRSKQLARELGFGLADQTRLATAISELIRNVLVHGGGSGHCHISNLSDASQLKIGVVVEDFGPGIADLQLALTDGYSTTGSLGAGLPGTKRLVKDFSIESRPGHTKISFVISHF